jgi:hypothetical protein
LIVYYVKFNCWNYLVVTFPKFMNRVWKTIVNTMISYCQPCQFTFFKRFF